MLRCAASINPNFAQPLNNIGILYTLQGQARAALEALQCAVAAIPTYAVAQNNLGVLLRDTGDIPEALRRIERAPRSSPTTATPQNYLRGNYVQPGESEEVRRAPRVGRAFPRDGRQPLPEREFDPETDPGPARPSARVGDWWLDTSRPDCTPTACRTLRRRADAPRPEPRARSSTPPRRAEDAQTALLREAVANAAVSGRRFERLRAIPGGDDSRRRRGRLELTGHTANNRLGALALRPAPVQVTWIGYPNTTGMREGLSLDGRRG